MTWKQACLLLAMPLALTACSENEEREGDEPVTVVADNPVMLSEQLQVEAVGSARAATSADLYPETAGRVVSVRFSAGDYVREGQPLLVLDSRQERLAVELAEVQVQEASQLLARYRRIEDTGAISDSQIEAGETALASARVELQQAQEALADRTVRAPFSGHIGLTEIDVGDRVGPDTLIAQLDQRSTLYVDFPAPEAAFSRLTPGTMVELSPFSDPDRTVQARVRAVDSSIATEQRTFTVRTAIDNSDDRLRPGMSFRVNFAGSGVVRPAVPEEAIVWGGEGSYLWQVVDRAAQRVPLTIASRRDGMALVDAAIGEDDLVIVEGVQKVREGQSVELVQPLDLEAQQVELADDGAAPESAAE
ncbi:efflux RND transporter periplasmic adaptor subunit [Aurantiacibacter poecillastricola]|uniref:efflux RND transporter periplasmic adaptor subunit n=1 Tax=Aurantiacibacter poecillastricola TaxID=3064385 RepID=UPI00273F15A1|nr:efflux RND transporter periplasmic adaptor subunit [Aurantiacibacter sp. 219JJ12-13]MDP5263006.1 efflux RND transporter periplasmic adaptor subunit [Aurantiacibacter sp. 219JJ12-13]